MPFNRLLFTALEDGATFKESGKTVSFKAKEHVSTLMFCLDKHADDTRAALGLTKDDVLCDLLVYLISSQGVQEPKRLLWFVECKGKDLPHAEKQLTATAQALQKRIGKQLVTKVHWMAAVLCSHGSSPNRKGRKSGPPPPFTQFRVVHATSELEECVFGSL